jgi:hypothetical protein
MTENPRSTAHDSVRRWRPRFGIGALLMVMFVFSVMATAGSYLVRSSTQAGRPAHLVFILFTLSAPTLLMIVVSLLRRFLSWLGLDKGF